ncbi:hypothetical protein ACH5RR_009198 [Cinchona calisaya]|uniref:AB hydrolase-1 domain-containing protein n=1 Tax=Cinchona calisaya TaxID=153742 RepID=A0ABD3ADI4_9GENT
MDHAIPNQQKHFILVHGACHGAWCWYKLKPLLESAGHRVTAIDLSASGINTKGLHELRTFSDYSEPLMELMAAIPPDQKVILVGHSYGGLSIALAMDHYPEKISIAVFVAAFIPDVIHAPSYPVDRFFERERADVMMDTQFSTYGSPEEPITLMLFGPQLLSFKLYGLCSVEDRQLAKLLMRPSPLFLDDTSKAKSFSKERFGSVNRAYVVCNEDQCLTFEFQHWLIENSGTTEVKEIKDADHMPMLSKPRELCQILQEITDKYI